MGNEAVRKASQKLVSLLGKSCGQCGSTKRLQRHHQEYTPTSFVILCQVCHKNEHMKDGTWGRGLRQMSNCIICGKDFKPLDSKIHKTCGAKCLSVLGRLNAMKRWNRPTA